MVSTSMRTSKCRRVTKGSAQMYSKKAIRFSWTIKRHLMREPMNKESIGQAVIATNLTICRASYSPSDLLRIDYCTSKETVNSLVDDFHSAL
jgi:hypothetical protein